VFVNGEINIPLILYFSFCRRKQVWLLCTETA